MSQAIVQAPQDQWRTVTQHCRLLVPVYGAEFSRVLCERYQHFIDHLHLFALGEYIPSPLHILIYDVEAYRDHSALVEMMRDCIEERWKGRFKDYVLDSEFTEVAMCWEAMQADMVHDMEVFLTHMHMSFLHPDTKQVTNSPIVEVW
jgi:hypothetical protein